MKNLCDLAKIMSISDDMYSDYCWRRKIFVLYCGGDINNLNKILSFVFSMSGGNAYKLKGVDSFEIAVYKRKK